MVGESTLFIDVRPMQKGKSKGYVSSQLFDFAPPAITGNALSISIPFGIYNYTVLDYLKTRQSDIYQ